MKINMLGASAGVDDFIRERRNDIQQIESLAFNGEYDSGFRKKTLTITSSTSIAPTDFNIIATASSGDITATLETSPVDGQEHHLKNNDSSTNNLIVSFGSTIALLPGQSAVFKYFASAWKIMSVSSATRTSLVGQSAVSSSVSASTSEETLATVTIPANSMGANGSVEIEYTFSMTESTNGKTMRAKFGGTTYKVVTITSSATETFAQKIIIYNVNSTSSQKSNVSLTGSLYASSGNPVGTSSIDTTADVTVLITGQKASAGETLTLENYRVVVNYKS